MPRQRPGKSDTVVRTPPEFIRAVKMLLCLKDFAIDLAAHPNAAGRLHNAVAKRYYSFIDDALIPRSTWVFDGWDWCNPPYDNITPWVAKAVSEMNRGAKVAMLVPASVGSNWWAKFVHEQAWVSFLNGRITFNDRYGNPVCSKKTGKPTPYPKDLALLLYGLDPGYETWRWK